MSKHRKTNWFSPLERFILRAAILVLLVIAVAKVIAAEIWFWVVGH